MWIYADIQNVADIVRHHGATTPHKTALIEGSHSLTFGELDQISNQLATHLQSLGVRQGDTVGFFGKNSIPFFEILYAAAKVGATLMPLNWRLATPELVAIVSDDATKRRELSRRYRIEQTYSYDDYDACLEQVDAVYIALPRWPGRNEPPLPDTRGLPAAMAPSLS